MIIMVVASWYILLGIITLAGLNRWETYVNGRSSLGVNAWPVALIWPLIWVLAVGIGGFICLLHVWDCINAKERYSRFSTER